MDFADKNLGTKKTTTTTAHFKASKSDQKKYIPSGLYLGSPIVLIFTSSDQN